MSQANHATTTTRAPATTPAAASQPRFIDAAEHRRLAYRMFRTPGRRGRLRDAEWAYSNDNRNRLYQLPAWKAWQLACRFPSPSLGRRYAEALS